MKKYMLLLLIVAQNQYGMQNYFFGQPVVLEEAQESSSEESLSEESLHDLSNDSDDETSKYSKFHKACVLDQYVIAKNLIEENYDMRKYDDKGFAPIHFVSSKRVLDLFLRKNKEDIINFLTNEDSKELYPNRTLLSKRTLLDIQNRFLEVAFDEEKKIKLTTFINYIREKGGKTAEEVLKSQDNKES